MKHLLKGMFAASMLLAPVAAQAQNIGLQMGGGILTVIYGQACGPVTCTPHQAGLVTVGESRNLMHGSAPQQLYAIAIGLPGPCVAVPGFENVLLLSSPVILDWGVTSAPPFVGTGCNQGLASASLTLPSGTPSGITFRVQSMGIGDSGSFAFGPALEATTF